MLQRVEDSSAHVAVWRASGTVLKADVEAALADAAIPGLVIEVGDDFDGYLAEIARGLEAAGQVERIAVVMDAELLPEAVVARFQRGRATVRLYANRDRSAAWSWANGAD